MACSPPATLDPDLDALTRRMQALSAELDELRRREQATLERHARERLLEQLRWRLASIATSLQP
jgi:hypothetical protein